MLCLAQNHRLQVHGHCCLTWIFCVTLNMRDHKVLISPFIVISGLSLVQSKTKLSCRCCVLKIFASLACQRWFLFALLFRLGKGSAFVLKPNLLLLFPF